MQKKKYERPFLLLLGCCLIFSLLLAACGQGGTSTPVGGNGQGSNNPGNAGTVTGNGTPAQNTTCPANGTARAAVLPSLPAGTQASIVYIINKGSATSPTSGTLERYDVVSGKSIAIATFSSTYLSDAELSSSGDWILFVAIKNQQAKLQLV